MVRSWKIIGWVALCSAASPPHGLGALNVTVLVRSQDTPSDRQRVVELRDASQKAGWPHDAVIGMHEAEVDFGHSGLWTYKPWIYWTERKIRKMRKKRPVLTQRWLVFVEPATMVDFNALEQLLSTHDAREPHFLGRKLVDSEYSIVHHYSIEPPYPHAHAGFAISAALAKKLLRDLAENPLGFGQQIEPVWELASQINGLGVKLLDKSDEFCTNREEDCSTWIVRRQRQPFQAELSRQDIVIAVKTVSKFHASRLPLVHELWSATSPAEVLFLSNQAVPKVAGIRVVDLTPEFGEAVDPSRESTELGSGHCSKMQAILTYLHKYRPGLRWYVVTDDDTLLNVPRLLAVLASHDDRKALYVGERYGWAHREDEAGTNYITTGGGMALSGPALAELQACEHCQCPNPNEPDDMTLGTWLTSLPVQLVHEEGFHQAEPLNYHPEVLRFSDPAISFHRYAVRLPASAPEDEVRDTQMSNWKAWKKDYFRQRDKRMEL